LLSAAPTRDDAPSETSLTRRLDMAKELKCSDVGMKSCNFVAQGKDEKEVMTKAAEHAKYAHGMNSMPPDVEKKARAAIREAGAAKDTQTKPFTMGPSKI
jgi:predicted small metal-binding protein